MHSRILLITLFSFALEAVANPKSFYSTTASKFVALVESSEFEEVPEIDHFREICPGYGGYELLYEGGDARSWLNVRFRGQTSDLWADTMQAARGMFAYKANDVVEWRGIVKDGNFLPYAIIYRIDAGNPDPDETEKKFSTLVVVALKEGKSQVIGSAHGKDENAKAQKIADDWWEAGNKSEKDGSE